jgi:hypothetical protein
VVGNWSLISVLLALLTFGAAVLLILLTVRKRDEEEDCLVDENAQSRQTKLSILNGVIALLGLMPAVVFIVLDDMTANMAIINKNTIWVVIAAAIVAALMVVRVLLNKKTESEDGDGFINTDEASKTVIP